MAETTTTIDEVGAGVIREAHFEWRTGHAPDATLREYITAYMANVENSDEGDWGRVCRIVGLRRKALDKTHAELQALPEQELDEMQLPDEYR